MNLTPWSPQQIKLQNEYVGRACTLAGQPAKITRNPDGYARIAPLNPAIEPVPYSWVAVWNTMDNRSGKFD